MTSSPSQGDLALSGSIPTSAPAATAGSHGQSGTTSMGTQPTTPPKTSPSSAESAICKKAVASRPPGKIYYADDNAGIYILHGDCREILPTLALADGAALVCDPPYGTQEFNGGYGRAHVTIANDSDVAAFAGMLSAWPVSPSWCLAFCDTRKRREAEDALLASGFSLVGEAVWDKGMPSLGYTVRYAHEAVIVARRGDIKPESPLISVLRGRRTMREIAGRHPHEKPDEVMGRLIEFCVPPDGVAVDPFCGSGSTLVAAKNLGRKAIGIEIEEKYCEIAANRLSQEVLAL